MKLQHDPEKNIFSYSGYILSDVEKSLLLKDLILILTMMPLKIYQNGNLML